MADGAGSSLLQTAFMAVASCAAVHVGFAAFGLEPILHDLGAGLFGGEPHVH